MVFFSSEYRVTWQAIESHRRKIEIIFFSTCTRVLVLFAIFAVFFYPKAALAEFIRNNNQESVIVFVHGFLSNATSAWTNAEARAYWPDVIKQDDRFDSFDIYVHEFETSALHEDMSIGEVAGEFEVKLTANDILSRKNIVFIGHSMGGLVVRQFIVDFSNRDFIDNIKLVMLYATPTKGSDLANITKSFNDWVSLSENPQLPELLPFKTGSYVDRLQDSWLRKGLDIPTFCAFEKRKTYGMTVVTKSSAISFCSRQSLGIEANHFDIVKPRNIESSAHQFLISAVQQTIKDNPKRIFIIDSRYRKASIPRIQSALSALQSELNLTLEPLIVSDYPRQAISGTVSKSQPDLIIIHASAFREARRCDNCDEKLLKYISAVHERSPDSKYLVYSGHFYLHPERGRHWLATLRQRYGGRDQDGNRIYPKYLDQIETLGLRYFPRASSPTDSDVEFQSQLVRKVRALLR